MGQGQESSALVLTWGGLHGGLLLALPLADGRSWILATTYIVVVFSMVLQGGSLGLFLRRFKPTETRQPPKNRKKCEGVSVSDWPTTIPNPGFNN